MFGAQNKHTGRSIRLRFRIGLINFRSALQNKVVNALKTAKINYTDLWKGEG